MKKSKDRSCYDRILKKIGCLSIILFSLFFFVISLTNVVTGNKIRNETKNKENNIQLELDEQVTASLVPVERNNVFLPNLYDIEKTSETIKETTIEEATTEETTTEETTINITTELEHEVEVSTSDSYINSLINDYSDYDTRIDLTYDNVLLMGQLVHSEAGDQPHEGKIAVAEVVLNRLDNDTSCYTISDVIFKPHQFEVVSNGSIYNTPTNDDILASIEAICGSKPTGGAIYFDDPRICSSWASRNRPYAVKIGDHQFYY